MVGQWLRGPISRIKRDLGFRCRDSTRQEVKGSKQ